MKIEKDIEKGRLGGEKEKNVEKEIKKWRSEGDIEKWRMR